MAGAEELVMTLDEGGWRRSNVQVFMPPPALRGVVEHFWTDRWTNGESSSRTFRVVADDAPHILWYLSGDRTLRTQRVSVAGARTRHHDVDLTGREWMVGARLVPGAIPMLFNVPAWALTNRAVPLEAFVSASVASAVGRPGITSPRDLADNLSALIEQICARRLIDDRVAWIAGRSRADVASVSAFARAFDMSSRGVRAWSAATLGMGLKRLLKIRRLHAALELRLSRVHDTWGRAAAAAGYADQPHFIRDCRAFLGESPAAFISRGCLG